MLAEGKPSSARMAQGSSVAKMQIEIQDEHENIDGGMGWCRVKAGNWLGPSGLCHTVEALVNRVQPGGLQCKVVATSGGGAPVLCTSR